MSASGIGRTAAVLVARSALAATPLAELHALTERVASRPDIDLATFCFTDYGSPSLRETILRLRGEGFDQILILLLFAPLEPALRNWLQSALARWWDSGPGDWPAIHVAPAAAAVESLHRMVDEMADAARLVPPVDPGLRAKRVGGVIPAEKRRALICQDYPCNNAGAAVLWLRLRGAESSEVACARTSCLGPCGLGPVVQVFPDGTYYCGVDEPALDRIIEGHLRSGRVVEDLAYRATGRKQFLR